MADKYIVQILTNSMDYASGIKRRLYEKNGDLLYLYSSILIFFQMIHSPLPPALRDLLPLPSSLYSVYPLLFLVGRWRCCKNSYHQYKKAYSHTIFYARCVYCPHCITKPFLAAAKYIIGEILSEHLNIINYPTYRDFRFLSLSSTFR